MQLTHRHIALFFCYWLVSITSLSSPLVFVVISDTHIDTSDTLSIKQLQLCVEDINRRDSIDFVVHTGDITQSGDSLAMQTTKTLLDQLQVPYYVVAGNHDVSRHPTQPAYIAPIFGNDRFSFTQDNYRCIGFSAISPAGKQEGHMADETLQWLEHQLTTSTELPAIIFSHYPLQQGDIENAQALTNLLRHKGTIMALSGHYHRYMLFNYNGLPGIVNRAMMRTGEPEPGYTLYRITGNQALIHECLCGQVPILWITLPLTLY